MAQVRSWAGLDVHAAKVVAATIDAAIGGVAVRAAVGVDERGRSTFCRALPGPMRVAYEAGPTGFGLARELAALGVGVRDRGAGQDRAGAAGSRQDRPA